MSSIWATEGDTRSSDYGSDIFIYIFVYFFKYLFVIHLLIPSQLLLSGGGVLRGSCSKVSGFRSRVCVFLLCGWSLNYAHTHDTCNCICMCKICIHIYIYNMAQQSKNHLRGILVMAPLGPKLLNPRP